MTTSAMIPVLASVPIVPEEDNSYGVAYLPKLRYPTVADMERDLADSDDEDEGCAPAPMAKPLDAVDKYVLLFTI